MQKPPLASFFVRVCRFYNLDYSPSLEQCQNLSGNVGKWQRFYKFNAAKTGVVKLADFVRVFTQKVTALPHPRALTCHVIGYQSGSPSNFGNAPNFLSQTALLEVKM